MKISIIAKMIHTIVTPAFSSTLSGVGATGLLKEHLLHPVVEEMASIDSDTGDLSTSPSSVSSDLPVTSKTMLQKAVEGLTQNVDPCSLKHHSDCLLDD